MNKEEELKCITTLKALMMLAVVLYHSILALVAGGWGGISFEYTGKVWPAISLWLQTMHTYAFVFASGYLFYMIRYELGKYRTTRKDIVHRMKKLLVPYFAISILWVTPFKLIYFGGDLKRVLFHDILLGISPAQLWFLPMLFIVFLVFYFMSDLFDRMRPRYAVILLLGLYDCKVLLDNKLPLGVFQIGNAMEYLLFFYLGCQYRKADNHYLLKCPSWLAVATQILVIGAYDYLRGKQNLEMIAVLLKPFVCLTSVYFAVYVCSKAMAFVRENKLNRMLRENGMGIYVLHQQFIYIIMRALNRDVVQDTIFVLLCWLFAMLCSLIVCIVLKRYRFGRAILG